MLGDVCSLDRPTSRQAIVSFHLHFLLLARTSLQRSARVRDGMAAAYLGLTGSKCQYLSGIVAKRMARNLAERRGSRGIGK